MAASVHASSVGVYAPAGDDEPRDERHPASGIPTSSYSVDEAAVERQLDALEAEHPEVRVVRLRPGLIFQRDAASEIRRLFGGPLVPRWAFAPGRLPLLPDVRGVRFQAVHADDVGDAVRRALVGDARGAFNLATDDVLTVATVAELLGARTVGLPLPVARAGAVAAYAARLTPTPVGWLDIAAQVPVMDMTRAHGTLGWRPTRPGREALAELLGGLRDGAGAATPPLAPDGSGAGRAGEVATGHGGRTRTGRRTLGQETPQDMSSTTTRPLAVVTGASHGIGLELARQFATHDFDLIVAAEDAAIHATAVELSQDGRDVQAVQVDLATDEGVDALYEQLRSAGRPADVVALNAGIGAGGAFATDTALEDELRIVDLNVRSTVHLAKHVTKDMVRRGEGRLLFTSSIASTMPGSFQAVYNASKSFVQSFALALRNELKDTGVTVTSLMPGPTDTEFFERADMEDTKVGSGDKDSAADVARAGFEAVMAGDERAVAASLSTKAQAAASRVLPDAVKAQLHPKQAEPGSA